MSKVKFDFSNVQARVIPILKRVEVEDYPAKIATDHSLWSQGLFHFEKPVIQKIACADEADIEILELLFEAGNAGMLPKDLTARLTQFRIRRHQVSRRILRMNKRLERELREGVAEKRGWHWALTSFAYEVWGEIEKARESKE
jgi:hypothetical protein